MGIPEDVQPRIFEPFFTTKPTGEGTGLGLTMVYNIVQNHQGAIVVESTPGLGTAFHLYFPAATPAGPVTGSHPALPDVLVPFGRGRRIMLVDDDAAVRHVGERMLTRLGFVPVVFSEPRSALDDFRQFSGLYCAVLSDLTMPGMTGVELAAEFVRLRPDLPLLLASGYLHKLAEQAAWTTGVRHIIHKPFQLEELATQLRAVLKEPAT
jgi:CheY-like chemotaxis protein